MLAVEGGCQICFTEARWVVAKASSTGETAPDVGGFKLVALCRTTGVAYA